MTMFVLSAAACSGNEVIVDIGGDSTKAPTQTETAADPATNAPTDAPTAAPTTDPKLTPEPTKVPDRLPEGQVLWLNTCPTDLYGISEEDAEAWFADAVFVGDSIVLGWRNYNNKKLETIPDFFGQVRFLCEGGLGVGNALWPVSEESVHPVYQGQKRLLWDSIEMMGPKKVFLCFGVNDIAVYGVEGTAQNYETVINKILEKTPDVSIYVISSMYLMDDSHQIKLTNANLRTLNGMLRDMCERRGFKFIDIASHLVGPDGNLKAEYCNEPNATTPVHQTYAAYDIWAKILRSLAAHDIVWGY